MADDDGGIGDLLEGMDDLDAALFGKSSQPKKPTNPTRNTLSSILDKSSAPASSAEARKPTVTFSESNPSNKRSLDDLFGDPTPSVSQAPPARQPRPQTNLGDLFGTRRKDPSPASAQTAVPQAPTEAPSRSDTNIETQRIQRLENEIERLNRELDDVKQRKRDDEEDLERLWKERLDKVQRENSEHVESLRSNHQKHVDKLEEDHRLEIDRIKTNYERQVESITGTMGQSREIINVVERVDNISSTIEKIAFNVSTSSDKIRNEEEITLKVREEKINLREQKLHEDIKKFEDERQRIHELNIRLSDLCKQQETFNENEKWKVREEWRKLQVEKEVFRTDQKYILDNIEEEKRRLEQKMATFYKDQHELLVRVTNERQYLDRERNEFYTKRNLDIKRIKEEVTLIDEKIKQVISAEMHVEDLKKTYESKMRQVQDLEISLMEECSEIDRMRNQLQTASLQAKSFDYPNPTHHYHMNDESTEDQNPHNIQIRTDSVRNRLKKNAELLEKYVGQKVAAVAPRNN